jgi:hypothetical protein
MTSAGTGAIRAVDDGDSQPYGLAGTLNMWLQRTAALPARHLPKVIDVHASRAFDARDVQPDERGARA